MFRVLILAAALLLAPATVHAAPAGAPSSEAEFNVMVGKVVDFSAAHQAALTAASNLVILSITGMEKALALSEERASEARVKSEMDAWEGEVRAQIAALDASKALLPPFPTQTFERLALLAPQYRGKGAAYSQVKVAALKSIDVSIQFAERSVDPARRAAGGDADALTDLAVELVTGLKLILLSENAMLDISIAAGQPEHPQTALARSIRGSNSGIALVLDYQVATGIGEPSDSKIAAAAIRAKAAEARAAALEMIPLAGAMAKGVSRAAGRTDTGIRMLKILETYKASSAVEVAVADVLDRVADLIESGEANGDKLEAATAPVEAQVARRQEIQMQRLNLLRP